MMGDMITLKDSLIITGFSMIVVFIGLIIISIIIGLLQNVSGGEDKKKEVTSTPTPKKSTPTTKEKLIEEVEEDNDELIAVIAAAVAASMGVGVGDIVVRDIKRIDDSGTNWLKAGLQEQMMSKL